MGRFAAANVPSGALAAELLLMSAVGQDRTWIYAHPESPLDASAEREFLDLIEKRSAGTPTQYLTGKQEFWGLEFEVAPGVLIPRPETEHLIEVAVDRIGASRKNDPLLIADVGTGSGCIAVALAKEFPRATIVATDIWPPAISIAKRNADKHGLAERIIFLHADLLKTPNGATDIVDNTARSFHLIVSNPPYIPSIEVSALAREVREHEPEIALFGGPEGLDVYERLIGQAGDSLRDDGLMVLELGYKSLSSVQEMLEASRRWQDIQITNDLAGIPRVISAKRVDR